MASELQGLVTGDQVLAWIIIAFLVGYFIYKEFPEFKKRVSKSAIDEKQLAATEKSVIERLDKIEKKLNELDEKLAKDYERINDMEKEQREYRKMQANSLKERKIIMRALLALMEGAEENKMIKESEEEINAYLLEQAHYSDGI